MRKKVTYIALLFAVGLLAWSWGDRRHSYREFQSPTYHPSLYYSRIAAIDEATNQPIDFSLLWTEDANPFGKGCGPTKQIRHSDGSQSLILVGLPVVNGLPVTISAAGYEDQRIDISPQGGGSITVDDEIVTIALRRKKQAEQAVDGNPH